MEIESFAITYKDEEKRGEIVMRKGLAIIYITILFFGLSACVNPSVEENKDTGITTENTAEITETTMLQEDTEKADPVTEDISEEPEVTTEQQTELENDMVPAGSKESGTAEKKEEDRADESFFGTWKVTAYYIPGVSAMTLEDAQGYVGKVCEYSADAFNGDGEVTQTPDYQEFEETESDFAMDYRATFESVGLTGDSVKKIEISNSYGFGCQFFIKDADIILICQDGVFFEAVRQ